MNAERAGRRRPGRGREEGERGLVLVMTALMIVPLLIFSAFAVDLGSWYAQSQRMQRAADAAALAGVVWMPDLAVATSTARTVATRNGFTHGVDGVRVVVRPGQSNNEQLEVEISAPGDLTVGRLVMDSVALDRAAVAEYVLPVPLGSPRNFFGTGDLDTGYDENLWLAVNTWCTDTVDGDRYQSRYSGNRTASGYSTSTCPSNPSGSSLANPEYRPDGYEFYIDVPARRPSGLQIRLYDARYRFDHVDTRVEDDEPYGGPDLPLFPTRQDPRNNNESSQITNDQDYTFRVFAPDDTPLDDTDNPVAPDCPARTYARSTGYASYSYLGETRWNTLCTIGTNRPAGRYILRVTNQANARSAAGSNSFGIVARYSNASGNGLCDSRTLATCPRVYGKDAISVFADQSGSTANFFLSEIDPIHEGKIMRISLFDPGEGGSNIRIRRPSGSNSYTDATFTWTSSNGASGGPTTTLDVSGTTAGAENYFNGHTVEIQVNLAGYNPPSNNRWWQIQYNFGRGDVTDRTTWSVSIVGDPVHLIE